VVGRWVDKERTKAKVKAVRTKTGTRRCGQEQSKYTNYDGNKDMDKDRGMNRNRKRNRIKDMDRY
jgi:hypothetical protein